MGGSAMGGSAMGGSAMGGSATGGSLSGTISAWRIALLGWGGVDVKGVLARSIFGFCEASLCVERVEFFFWNRAVNTTVHCASFWHARANPLASLCLMLGSGGKSLGIGFVAAGS